MKRFFSALLSLVLAIGLLGYLPVQVYAVDITNYVLTYPVTQGHNRLSRGYSTATGHYAIDISPKPDSSSNKDDVAVMAVYDGVVIKVFTGCRNWSGFGSVNCKDAGNCNPSGGYVEKSGDTYHFCNDGFGNGVIIYHPATKTYSAYAHMRDSITVNVGDNVVAGQLIGYMGSYGCSNGKHLHFEMVNTTASSPSINDYWKNYNKHNFVNTNPYGDITVTSTAQRNPDNIYYNFVDMPIVVENPNPGDTGNITTSWEVYSNEAKTGDTWIRPAVKCTMNVTTEKVSKVVMYIYNKDMSKQLLKVTESNLSLSGKYYYFTSYFYSNKKDTASNLTWEPSNAVTLCSGTTYKYKFVATVSGKDYESPVFEMSTTGTESHNWNSGSVTKQPTCTATGVKTYTCRTCGVTKTESIAAKGHTPGPAATCLSAQTCTVCGVQLASSTWHKFDSGTITKRPTCMEEGIRTYTCIYCGHTETEPVSRSNSHTPGAEATCTSPQKCIDCGEQLAPPTGHNFDNGIIIKEPTCLEDGIKIFTCSSCGTTRTEPVYGRGHIRGEAATCTAPQTCTVCGTQLAPPLGHNYSGSYYYSAHPHEEYQKCTRCNAGKKTGNTKKVDGCSICYPIVTFTITYNANGGTGAPSPQTKESGKALTLSSVKPTRQDYTFLGWATSSGASSAQYNAGSSFTVDANTTLYAVWRKDEVITSDVNFELSSANAVPGSTVELTLKVAGTTKVDLLTVYNILYDKSVLEFQGVSEYGDLVKKCALPDNAFDDSNMSFTMGYADSTTASGTIAVLKFKVKDNAPEKDIIISYEAVATKDRLPVESSVKTSVVSISKWLSGDFNEDGKINMKDAVYFIGWVGAPFLPQFQINHSFNADFNKDGKINMKDAVYFIGWVGAPFLPQFKIDW